MNDEILKALEKKTDSMLGLWLVRYNALINEGHTYDAEQVIRCINEVKRVVLDELAAILTTRQEVAPVAVKRDRPAHEPGGVECQKCGCIFIGEEWHSVCAVCVDNPASERLCDFFADVGEVERFMDELCNVVTELTGDEGEDNPITVLRRYIDSTGQTSDARDALDRVDSVLREFEGMTGAGYKYMAANIRAAIKGPK